jgi:hypothetical protein
MKVLKSFNFFKNYFFIIIIYYSILNVKHQEKTTSKHMQFIEHLSAKSITDIETKRHTHTLNKLINLNTKTKDSLFEEIKTDAAVSIVFHLFVHSLRVRTEQKNKT